MKWQTKTICVDQIAGTHPIASSGFSGEPDYLLRDISVLDDQFFHDLRAIPFFPVYPIPDSQFVLLGELRLFEHLRMRLRSNVSVTVLVLTKATDEEFRRVAWMKRYGLPLATTPHQVHRHLHAEMQIALEDIGPIWHPAITNARAFANAIGRDRNSLRPPKPPIQATQATASGTAREVESSGERPIDRVRWAVQNVF